jgi:hypothetical protein
MQILTPESNSTQNATSEYTLARGGSLSDFDTGVAAERNYYKNEIKLGDFVKGLATFDTKVNFTNITLAH